MKIAGGKNQGAWFRFNKWLNKGGTAGGRQSLGIIAALKTAILAGTTDTLPTFHAVMLGIAVDAGIGSSFPATEAAWVDAWLARGIPLQIWMGRLSWVPYDRVGSGSAALYIPRGQSEAHYFAHDLRIVCRHFVPSIRELGDLANFTTNNPGFLPDAHKHVTGADAD